MGVLPLHGDTFFGSTGPWCVVAKLGRHGRGLPENWNLAVKIRNESETSSWIRSHIDNFLTQTRCIQLAILSALEFPDIPGRRYGQLDPPDRTGYAAVRLDTIRLVCELPMNRAKRANPGSKYGVAPRS